jgi:hypothetical protein
MEKAMGIGTKQGRPGTACCMMVIAAEEILGLISLSS